MKLEIIEEKPQKSDNNSLPILFIHGVLHGAWCWENFMAYLPQKGIHCFAVSLRGHGGSPLNGSINKVSLDDYIEDIRLTVEYIENKCGTRPILIGHSMGGFIAQKYLETHNVPAAILLASAPPHGVIFMLLRLLKRSPLTFIKMSLTMKPAHLIKTNALARAFAFSKVMSEEEVSRHRKRMCDESFLACLEMLTKLPTPKRIKTPLMVIGAGNDRVFSIKEIHKTAKAYKTKAEVFNNMAHDMMLEEGWEKVCDTILTLIDKNN
jgi:alpha-beta hydrolase superfamily lysophospholipase